MEKVNTAHHLSVLLCLLGTPLHFSTTLQLDGTMWLVLAHRLQVQVIFVISGQHRRFVEGLRGPSRWGSNWLERAWVPERLSEENPTTSATQLDCVMSDK